MGRFMYFLALAGYYSWATARKLLLIALLLTTFLPWPLLLVDALAFALTGEVLTPVFKGSQGLTAAARVCILAVWPVVMLLLFGFCQSMLKDAAKK